MPLPDLPSHAKDRTKTLQDTDAALAPTVDIVLTAQQDAVLMYLTTPALQAEDAGDHKSYEMDDPYPSSMHTDLKRDLSPREGGDANMQKGLPLFETYQFLTPGKLRSSTPM